MKKGVVLLFLAALALTGLVLELTHTLGYGKVLIIGSIMVFIIFRICRFWGIK